MSYNDFIALLTLGLQSADRTLDAFEAEMKRLDSTTNAAADAFDAKLNDFNDTLLHNIITSALTDPKVSLKLLEF